MVSVEEANSLRLLGVTFDKTLNLANICVQASELASWTKRLPF